MNSSSLFSISIALFAFAVLVAYLLIKLPIAYWMRWTLVPATLLLAWYLSVNIPALMGRAYEGTPGDQFQYIDHQVTKDRSTIEVWVKLPDSSTRLYGIPFDPQLAAQLDLAHEAMRQGVPVFGKFRSRAGAGSSGVKSDLQIEVKPNPHSLLPTK